MIDDLFMAFLEDKAAALKSLFDDIEKTATFSGGLNQFIASIDDCDLCDANLRKKLKTMMKVVNQQNTIIRKLLFINLAYLQGDNFDHDAGKALIKMGRGQDALRQILKNKMSRKD